MSTTQIDNNFRWLCCPICCSPEIGGIKALAYRTPIKFSTTAVELAHQPELWECRSCRSWFTQNIVPESTAKALYENGLSNLKWQSITFAEAKPPEITTTLRRIIQRGHSVLDVGCNTGELLDFCKELGATTYGAEPSVSSRAICERKGHTMHANIDQSIEPVNVVFAFDLIEHLYDIEGFFRKVWTALKPDGLLVILTGDNRSFTARWHNQAWWYLLAPEHIVFPSPVSFRQRTDFQLIDSVATVASKGYRTTARQWPLALALMLTRRGSGLPLVRPDHQLVVLKRQN